LQIGRDKHIGKPPAFNPEILRRLEGEKQMRFYTSNYAKSAQDPRAVAISQGVPKFYKGRVLKSLAPPWSLVKAKDLSEKEWVKAYHEKVLDKLDVQKIANYLGDGAVLLCWEKATDFCHRFIVGEWLESAGHIVTEFVAEFKNVKKTAAPVLKKYDTTGLNNEQCKIVNKWQIYLTYPKNHNQAKKILIEVTDKLSQLSDSEAKAVCKVLNIKGGINV